MCLKYTLKCSLIMTDQDSNRKIYLTIAVGNSQLFPGRLNPENQRDFPLPEGSAIICFIILLYASINEIAVHSKWNKIHSTKDTFLFNIHFK